jgi:hypothetical protein
MNIIYLPLPTVNNKNLYTRKKCTVSEELNAKTTGYLDRMNLLIGTRVTRHTP